MRAAQGKIAILTGTKHGFNYVRIFSSYQLNYGSKQKDVSEYSNERSKLQIKKQTTLILSKDLLQWIALTMHVF